MIKTNTELDDWIGGLPKERLLLVLGAPGAGKTAFLQALSQCLMATPYLPRYISPFSTLPEHIQCHDQAELEADIRNSIALYRKKNLVCLIDDLPYFESSRSNTPLGAWCSCFFFKVQGMTTVISMPTKRGLVAPTDQTPRALTHGAGVIVEITPLLLMNAGIVVELSCLKSRLQAPSKPLQLELARTDDGWEFS